MTVEELSGILKAKLISRGNMKRKISGGMVCDVMSLSLVRGYSGMAWVCQRADMNTLAAAVMTDAACVIFPQSTNISDEMIQRAESEQLSVLLTPKGAFEVVGQMYESGIRPGRSGQ